MTQQLIGVGTTANDGTGDTERAAFQKVNANFTDLYSVWAPNYVSGRYYCPPLGTTTTANAFAADTFSLVPIIIWAPITVSALGARCATGAVSSAIILGLFDRGGNLIAQGSGSAATTGNGADAICTFASPVAIAPGLYYLGVICNGAPSLVSIPNTSNYIFPSILGNATPVSNSGLITCLRATGTYAGGFPSNFNTASPTYSNAGNTPLLSLKVS